MTYRVNQIDVNAVNDRACKENIMSNPIEKCEHNYDQDGLCVNCNRLETPEEYRAREEEERENDEVANNMAEDLDNEELMEQYDIARGILELILDENQKKMLNSLLEMERELALREEKPY